MNNLTPKLKLLLLAVIAVALAVIAYRQLEPSYIETDKGIFLNNRNGKFYKQAGNKLIPVGETTEDKLRREFPEGKNY